MCGFAGFWNATGFHRDDGLAQLQRMSDALVHRGPDDEGAFVDGDVGVALGFRRLAIIDLTSLGHQPMASPSGRHQVVFNGEIYNHAELRAALRARGVVFRGRSDTEVLCAGFEVWGFRETLHRCAGMFAIAAWDTHDRVLRLARDRIGIKPLFTYAEHGFFSFGSEIKALQVGPRFSARINERAIPAYLSLLYVPGSASMLQGVEKLAPGSILEVADPTRATPASSRFWSVSAVAASVLQRETRLPDAEVLAEVESTLTSAVRSHMEADVPLGAFLSGGIDSTTVVALMQSVSSTPIRTFTVRFDDPVHDESEAASAIASCLGTEHTTIDLDGARALDWVPRLADIYDEPFADSSQLPSLLVAAAAKQHVTVVLTGDGGDELFGGYNRYTNGEALLPRVLGAPVALRRALGAMIDRTPAGSIDQWAHALGRIPGVPAVRLAEQKVRKLGGLLSADSLQQAYLQLISVGLRDGGQTVPEALLQAFGDEFSELPLFERMMLADQLSYLPENQMTKVDRASMASSLEARVPLLDHRVVEMSWRLPVDWKVRHGVGKYALRQIAYRRVPATLLDRPKTGFSVPLAAWLRGPLRDWAESHLDPASLRHGPLRVGDARTPWERLLRGYDDAAPAVWALIMFEAWRIRWIG
jgi:asparagine synthase (glutamine-hydrolysing)